VNDQIHPLEDLDEARRKVIDELRAVSVCDDADALGHAEQLSCSLNP
jgi:hypothetical protein